MQRFRPFAMERWQSTYENRVDFNLSESGVQPLTVGELLRLAGEDSIDEVLLGYGQSNGSDTLREEIARLYPGATAAGVVVGNGSAEANFVALWELVQPGDEVAIVVPTYMQTYGLAEAWGARVREIPLREQLEWQPDPADIAAAIGDRTRVVIVTNPNNPTGAVLGDEARAALIRHADRVGAWILADEVYTGAELEGDDTPSFFGAAPNVIATGSLSKAYGLPGLRIGWVVSDDETAERLWSRTDYTTISPGDLTDHLAAIALRPAVRARLRERTRTRIHTGLDIMEAWLAEQGIFTYRRPDAGAICFAHYDLPVNSSELAERLRVDRSVLVVPGDHFGRDRYIRFGFGIEPEVLRAALGRTAETLGSLTAAARTG